MFSSNGRDPFACRGVGCVKLPATAAFPTDEKLLQRIEAARRALPRNSMKPLWRASQVDNDMLVSELLTPKAEAEAQARAAAVQQLRVTRAELGATLVSISELYPNRAAAG